MNTTVRYRYVYVDDMLLAVRASPASKAATLSRESQTLVHAVRADLDEAALRGDREVHLLVIMNVHPNAL